MPGSRSSAAEPAPRHREILRLTAPNPGPMTLAGTNSYVVGSDPAYVIDPGPDDPDHLAALAELAERRGGIGGVLLTHSHLDHSAGVAALGAELLWGEVGGGDEASALAAAAALPESEDVAADPSAASGQPGQPRAGGDAASARAGPLEVIPTPGHAADHVAFLLGGVCFCGDLILGEGSSIVPPAAGGGSLTDYTASLERLAALDAELLCPGHGPWITAPAEAIDAYLRHRSERERDLLTALRSGQRSRAALLDAAWGDVERSMRPAAALAMQAHLEKLVAEGAVDL